MNKIIHILLRAAAMLAFPLLLIYLLLLSPVRPTLAPSQWLVVGGAALAWMLAGFLPGIVRRVRGLPQPPVVSPSDQQFYKTLGAVVSILVCFIAWMFGASGYMFLPVMLVPIVFALRYARRSPPTPNERNA